MTELKAEERLGDVCESNNVVIANSRKLLPQPA